MAKRTERSEVKILRMLAKNCRRNWQLGNASTAFLWLKYLGWIHRMTLNENEVEAAHFRSQPELTQREVILEALQEVRGRQLKKYAIYYLSKDARRFDQTSYSAWCNDFSSRVVTPRDCYQVALDTAVRFSLTGNSTLQSELALRTEFIAASLASVDQILRADDSAEREVRAAFRARLFVCPDYDLANYWWFPELIASAATGRGAYLPDPSSCWVL